MPEAYGSSRRRLRVITPSAAAAQPDNRRVTILPPRPRPLPHGAHPRRARALAGRRLRGSGSDPRPPRRPAAGGVRRGRAGRRARDPRLPRLLADHPRRGRGRRLDTTSPRGIVVLALACAACLGLATLGALGALATVFGFGWVVVALAAAVLVGALWSWPRVGPALGAAAGRRARAAVRRARGRRRADRAAERRRHRRPARAHRPPRDGLSQRPGPMLIDLRRTAIPRAARPLRIDAGVRRTIVALPHDRCVNVDVDYHVVPFAARVAVDRHRPRATARSRRSSSSATGASGAPAASATAPRAATGRRCASTSSPPAAASTCATIPTASIPRPSPTGPAIRSIPSRGPTSPARRRRRPGGCSRNWRVRHREQRPLAAPRSSGCAPAPARAWRRHAR